MNTHTLLHISDQDVADVVDAVARRGGSAFLSRIDAGLANRFPHSDAEERRCAMQAALHRRVVIITPMGDVRRPPEDNG